MLCWILASHKASVMNKLGLSYGRAAGKGQTSRFHWSKRHKSEKAKHWSNLVWYIRDASWSARLIVFQNKARCHCKSWDSARVIVGTFKVMRLLGLLDRQTCKITCWNKLWCSCWATTRLRLSEHPNNHAAHNAVAKVIRGFCGGKLSPCNDWWSWQRWWLKCCVLILVLNNEFVAYIVGAASLIKYFVDLYKSAVTRVNTLLLLQRQHLWICTQNEASYRWTKFFWQDSGVVWLRLWGWLVVFQSERTVFGHLPEEANTGLNST